MRQTDPLIKPDLGYLGGYRMEPTHACPKCKMAYFEAGICNWCSPDTEVVPYKPFPKEPTFPVIAEES